jgi:outer membrane protein assembly factor BamB
MKTILIAVVAALCAAIAVPAVAHKGGGKHHGKRPDVIALPPGFQPEGITTSKRHTFFVGSRENGAIYRGNLRTGKGDILVPGADPSLPNDDRGATGLKVDRHKRLFVSGANSKHIRVYDSRTGEQLRDYPVDAGFINDNVVTRQGVYFTDSQKQQLYFIPFGRKGALGELVTIPITGDFRYTAGEFNANGIEQAKGGKTLILISSHDGALYTADAATGATKRIAVSGGDGELENGDGIMRKGRKLFVVENRDDAPGPGVGVVSVVRLSRDLGSGFIARTITDADFDVPTTIARSGGRNYVVNGKFNTAPTPTTPYEVVKVPKR